VLRCDRGQSGREGDPDICVGIGRAIIVHAELAVAPFVASEHMIGMVEEIAVDAQRPEPFVAVGNRGQIDPVLRARKGIGSVLLEEQDIDDDIGARLLPHRLAGKAHRAEEIGNAVDMVASLGIALVERIARGHEQGDAAGPQMLERFGDEIVVKRQAELTEFGPVLDGEVREGRIADREVEVGGQRRLVEIDASDDLARIKRFCDPGGDGIVLDAHEQRVLRQCIRPQPHEEAAAASRLEHLAAGEAEGPGGVPHGADDVFGGVMRILRRAFERLEFDRGRFLDQAPSQFLPALAIFTRPTGEHVVGKFRRAETDEPGNRLLLGR